MVVQEGPPRLVRWPPEPAQDARHGAFGDGDTEPLEFHHESWVRATTDWRQPFVRSISGVLRRSRGDLDAGPVAWTTWPRICETVRAANGRQCLPGHKAKDVASRTTEGGE